MMTKKILAAGLVMGLLAASGVQAETKAPVVAAEPVASKDYKAAPGGAYTLDPNHTSVSWNISHMGMSNFAGRFDKVSGTMVYDQSNPTKSSLEVSVPVASIDTNNPKLEGELKGDKFFNAAKYPEITFKSTSLALTGPTSGKLAGEITLMGKTLPALFDVTLNGVGKNFEGRPTMGFTATTTIHRADFGLTAYAGVVGDTVTLTIQSEVGLEERK